MRTIAAGSRSPATISICSICCRRPAAAAAVGKTEFSPLQVQLALSNGLTDVLARIAGGDTLRGVKIEGVTAGERPMTVFELTLGDVHVTQVAEDGGTGDGETDQLAFSYDRILVETTGQNPDGSIGTTSSFGFNLATNTEIDTSTKPELNPASLYLDGTPGDDEIVGGVGNDTIDAKAGDDRVQAGSGDDIVLGGIGEDRLNGGDGHDALDGGDDDDVLEGGDGDDLLDGGEGDDRVFGDGGDDIIIGGNGNDGLNGGAGNDRFVVRNPLTDGADKYNGGAGSDTLDFSASTQSIVLTLADGTTTFRSIPSATSRTSSAARSPTSCSATALPTSCAATTVTTGWRATAAMTGSSVALAST